MDFLGIKLHVGNKRSKGELTNSINTHEEISEDDSVLPGKVRIKEGRFKYWKSGSIEEIDEKLKERKIEIVENNEKALINTKNKFLMQYAIEYANEQKDGVKLLKR